MKKRSAGHRGRRLQVQIIALMVLAGTAVGMAGCGLLGSKNQELNGGTLATPYVGFKDKSVAIVVHAQPATINEYAGAREEISGFVASQMRLNVPIRDILSAQEVINWQDNTINWFGLSERDVGKHFSVDRVVYIEVLDYSTRRILGYSDLQGHLRAQCKVIETDRADAAGTWTGVVDVKWPPDRSLDPTQTNENVVRQRTLEMFAEKLVEYFHGPS